MQHCKLAICQILDFLSDPGVKTLPSSAGDVGSIPGWGTKSLQALRCGQKQTNKTKTKTKHKDPEECLETSQGESSRER